MKKSWLIVLVALVVGFSTGCKKDQDQVTPGETVTVTFGLDIEEQVENFGLKSTSMPAWTHPLNTVTVVMMNLDSDDVYTESFTDINAMTMVVPSGNYHVEASNPVPGTKADYMHFTAEKNVIITTNQTVVLHAEFYQSLVTVSNAAVTPKVGSLDMYFDQDMHFMYIIDWTGEWVYNGKSINTSVTPVAGKRYHFSITSNGIVIEGIGEWENGNQSFIDNIVAEDLFNENNPNGFLFTKDATTGALWKWSRGDGAAAHNITEPMAYYLYKAGYTEIGELGYEAIWNDLNNGERFWSTSLSGLMGGKMATGDPKYMDMANTIMPAFAAKYHPAGTAPPRASFGLWGYDYLNILRSAKFAKENDVIGAETYYNEVVADYLANYVSFAATDYDRIFINVIAVELGIGTVQGEVTWDETAYGLQEAAYGLMGNSWADPSEVKSFILGNLESATYSEPLAEAIYALGL